MRSPCRFSIELDGTSKEILPAAADIDNDGEIEFILHLRIKLLCN